MNTNRKLRSFKRLKGIIVISLFDGMSCGQLALDRVGINIETYYASEIDKYAMQVTQHNYPNTIHIGSVLDITIERIGKFEILLNGKYIIDTTKLILIGGSPCQGFSFAGTMSGSSTECNIDVTTLEQYLDLKSKNFKFKGQSYLFWEYVRVLRDVKPMYYFLENVKMVKKWKGMFNDAMSHEPDIINSALVSAQNRVRLYWTNIPGVTQPDDKGIFIKDILEDEVDEKFYISTSTFNKVNGSSPKLRRYIRRVKRNKVPLIVFPDCINKIIPKASTQKTGTLLASYYKKNGQERFGTDPFIVETSPNGITNLKKGSSGKSWFFEQQTYTQNSKARSLKAGGGSGNIPKLIISNKMRVRKLTPIECERLQTVPDNYTSIVSNSQRYKMLGNGWTVEVISHIFQNLRPSR